MEKFYLGIDVGGTKIKGVLLDNVKNRWFSVFDVATPQNRKLFLDVLDQKIRGLIENKKIVGIGIGLPGIVNVKTGVLVKAPNLPFLNGWPAKKFFSKFKLRVKIDNDSRCFLRSEAILGAGKKYKNIVALTIGTGLGGGIMINGKIYYGSHNAAGEFGRMIMNDGKELEKLGNKKTNLKPVDRDKIIGLGISDLINALDPQIVILGGGSVVSRNINIKDVQKTARKYIMSPLARKIPITKGKLGNYSQALGAALLIKYKNYE